MEAQPQPVAALLGVDHDRVGASPEAVCRCGDPGLQFADQIARWHTCPNTGPVTASNPYGEFLHVADSACNLAALNLLSFLKDRAFDVEAFTAAVELLVVAQDAIVDGSGYPSEQIEREAPGGCARSGSATPTSPRCCSPSGFPTTPTQDATGLPRSPR